MRNIFILLILLPVILFPEKISYAQSKELLDHTISVYTRIGYQVADNRDKTGIFPKWYSEELPASFNFEAGIDLPLGKGYFGGVSYSAWFSNEDVRDDNDTVTFTKKIYGANVDIIFKYKYYFNKFIFSPGLGIGSTIVKTRYSGYPPLENEPRKFSMANFTLQLNLDYLLTKKLLLSMCTAFYTAKELKSGGNRHNNLLQFKAGIMYNINL